MNAQLLNTRNDLPVNIRFKVIEIANQHLADILDLKSQAKQAHWNVKGPNFFALHELFDKVASEVEELADTIAERAVALGGIAFGTVRLAAKHSRLAEYPLAISAEGDHITALSGALAQFGQSVRHSIDEAGQLPDAATADVFTEVSRAVDKLLWFVEAHQQHQA